ncbi:MAG: carboxypeptidase regulatory-like domain-containing protein [Candidatus Omnitrophota bacterium]
MMRLIISLLTVFLFLLGHVCAEDALVVFGVVVDKDTGKPIPNAVVYLGRGGPGFDRTYTNDNGEYKIRIPEDQNSIGVYKKGYYRFVKYLKKTGESRNNFELQKPDIPVEEISLTGRVIEQVVSSEKRGESRYVKIKTDLGPSFYLFDELGSNDIFIFQKWLNAMVRVTGYKGVGKVGWGYEDAEGIYVETITALY